MRNALAVLLAAAVAAGCQQTGGGRTTGTAVHAVTIVDATGGIYAYTPSTFTIREDRITEVTWTNDTDVIHKVKLVFLNGADVQVRVQETASIPPGESVTHTFSGGPTGNLRNNIRRISVREARGSAGGHAERGDITVTPRPR
jgi:plastocyanin